MALCFTAARTLKWQNFRPPFPQMALSPPPPGGRLQDELRSRVVDWVRAADVDSLLTAVRAIDRTEQRPPAAVRDSDKSLTSTSAKSKVSPPPARQTGNDGGDDRGDPQGPQLSSTSSPTGLTLDSSVSYTFGLSNFADDAETGGDGSSSEDDKRGEGGAATKKRNATVPTKRRVSGTAHIVDVSESNGVVGATNSGGGVARKGTTDATGAWTISRFQSLRRQPQQPPLAAAQRLVFRAESASAGDFDDSISLPSTQPSFNAPQDLQRRPSADLDVVQEQRRQAVQRAKAEKREALNGADVDGETGGGTTADGTGGQGNSKMKQFTTSLTAAMTPLRRKLAKMRAAKRPDTVDASLPQYRDYGTCCGVGGRMRLWMDRHLPSVIEDHPVVITLDLLFAILAVAGCVFAMLVVHPRSYEVNAVSSESQSDGLKTNFLGVRSSMPSDVLYSNFYFYNAVIQILTWLWMLSRFVVQTREGFEMVVEPSNIAATYIRHRLWFDLLYALPVEYFFVMWLREGFAWMQLRHTLRLLRLFDLYHSSNPLKPGRVWMQFVAWVCFGVIVMFALALGFWQLEAKHNLIDAMYWMSVTIVSVGYGDVVAHSESGKVFSILTCFVGLLLVSVVSAFATKLMTTKDLLEEQLSEKKLLLNSMFEFYDIPWPLRREIISLFPSVLDIQSEEQFRVMLNALPPFVATRIEGYSYARFLRVVPLFKDIKDPDLILNLSRRLHQRFVPASEYIVVAGDIGREMFFLVRGVVHVIIHHEVAAESEGERGSRGDPVTFLGAAANNAVPTAADETADDGVDYVNEVIATLKPNSFFGEVALMNDNCVRIASVQAVTLCELLVLSKRNFEAIIKSSVELERLFTIEVFKRRAQASTVASPRDPNRRPSSSAALGASSQSMSRPTSSSSNPLQPTAAKNGGGPIQRESGSLLSADNVKPAGGGPPGGAAQPPSPSSTALQPAAAAGGRGRTTTGGNNEVVIIVDA